MRVEVHHDAHNALNQVTSKRWVIPGGGGGTFTMSYGFGDAGTPTSMTYPGGNASQVGETVTFLQIRAARCGLDAFLSHPLDRLVGHRRWRARDDGSR